MDLPSDFNDLLAAFAHESVRFVVIGGYAVGFHGQPRATKDIDFLVAIDCVNRERLAAARTKFGVAPDVVSAARSMTQEDIVYFGISPLRVDILGSASGVEFESVYARAIRASVEGVIVPVIALADLVANKEAAARPQELLDCLVLRQVQAEQGTT